MIKKDLNYYLSLPYSMVVQQREDEGEVHFVSRVLELDGCHSDGATKEEALENLQEAFEGYLEAKLEYGDPIPEPNTYADYSGKFVIRMPKSLHYNLAREAERDGVSLNQYALYKLSR